MGSPFTGDTSCFLFQSESGNVRDRIKRSDFTVNFDPQLKFPEDATLSCRVLNANAWYVSPNLFNASFTYGGIPHVIPDGLYEPLELDDAIQRLLQNQTGQDTALFYVEENVSSGGMIIVMKEPNRTLDISPSLAQLMGFSQFSFATGGVGNRHFYSDLPPTFNKYNWLLVKTDMVKEGIQVNARNEHVIARIPLADVQPGSLVHYEPANPITLPLPFLAGRTLDRARFWITDENNKELDFLGNDWALMLELRS